MKYLPVKLKDEKYCNGCLAFYNEIHCCKASSEKEPIYLSEQIIDIISTTKYIRPVNCPLIDLPNCETCNAKDSRDSCNDCMHRSDRSETRICKVCTNMNRFEFR